MVQIMHDVWNNLQYGNTDYMNPRQRRSERGLNNAGYLLLITDHTRIFKQCVNILVMFTNVPCSTYSSFNPKMSWCQVQVPPSALYILSLPLPTPLPLE